MEGWIVIKTHALPCDCPPGDLVSVQLDALRLKNPLFAERMRRFTFRDEDTNQATQAAP